MPRNRDKTPYGIARDQGVWREMYEALVEKYNTYWQSVDPDYVPRKPIRARQAERDEE